MTRKWKDNRGETLIEVLASILIGVLSVALLFSAVMASANMDRSAKAADKAFYENFTEAEKQKTVFVPFDSAIIGDDGKVEITGNSSPAKVKVNFYGGDGALSYKLSP